MASFIQRYDQIRTWSTRDQLRHWALSGLAFAGKIGAGWTSHLNKHRIQFVYGHYLFDDQHEQFRAIVSELSRNHKFIGYSEAVDRILTGDIDASYLTFSFDDGFKNCLHAARILEDFGTSACFFICPSIIGETDFVKVQQFCSDHLHLPPIEFLNWSDVEQLQKNGHEVGSHTFNHPDLGSLSKDQLNAEIGQSREFLQARLGNIQHFAWPYGRFQHFSSLGATDVFDSGFKSCASAERGCHTKKAGDGVRDLCIRRDQLKASWPVDHVLYFLSANSRRSDRHQNGWPLEWADGAS